MKFLLAIFFLQIAMIIGGCAVVNELTQSPEEKRQSEKEGYEKEARERVVYTPLSLKKREKTDPDSIDILLRPPKEEYFEIGIISIYRKYTHETAADLLPFIRERAAQEGADSVLLSVIEEKNVGLSSEGSGIAYGDALFTTAEVRYLKEGTISGYAIIFK